MSPLFSAQDGAVTFKGRPLSDFTTRRVRLELIRCALNVEQKSWAFKCWMEATDQIIAAQSDAAEQNRKAA